MPHAKTQRRKGEEALPFFAPLRLCVRYFSVCFLSTLTGCVPAIVPRTPAISGHVYNAATTKPVDGAIVTFENERKIAAKTDHNGAFVLPPHKKIGKGLLLPFDARPCRIKLLINHEGFHNYSSWVLLEKPTSGMEVPLQPY